MISASLKEARRLIFSRAPIPDMMIKIAISVVILSFSIVLLLKLKSLNFSILYSILFFAFVAFASKKIATWQGLLSRWAAPAFLLFGLVLRLYWGMYSGAPLTSDHAQYFWMGQQILDGKFLFHPFKQSGAGILTAVSFFLTNHQTVPVALFPIAFGSWLQCLLGYHGLKTLGHRRAAVAFCLWTVFWPEHWLTTNMLAAANDIATFFVISWWLIVMAETKLSDKSSYFCVALAGVSIGFMQYIRGTGVFVLIGFLFQMLFSQKKFFKTVMLALGFFATVFPIYIYNINELGITSISPSQNSGVSLLIGTNTATQGHYFPDFNDVIVDRMINELKTTPNVYPGVEIEDLRSLLTMENILFHPERVTRWAVFRNETAKAMAIESIRAAPFKQLEIAIQHKMPIYWGESTSLVWSLENTPLSQFEKVLQVFSDNSILVLLASNVFFLALLLRKPQDFKPYYGAIFGCFLMGSLHLIVEIQSQYHLSHLTFYSLFAFSVFRDKQLT